MTSLEQRILHTEVAQLGTTDAEDNVRRLMTELEGQDNEIVDALNHQRELRKQRRVRGWFVRACASAHRVAVLMRVLHQRLLRRRQRELARHREQLQAQRAAPTTEDTITEEDEALVDAER